MTDFLHLAADDADLAAQPTNTSVYDLSGVTFRCGTTTDGELAHDLPVVSQ